MTDATISIIVTSITSIVLVILNRKQANKIATVANVVTEVKGTVVEQAKAVKEVKDVVVEQAVKTAAAVEKVDEIKVAVIEQIQKVEKIVGAVDGYHKEVNGKMSLLLEKTEALAKAEQKIQNGNIS